MLKFDPFLLSSIFTPKIVLILRKLNNLYDGRANDSWMS